MDFLASCFSFSALTIAFYGAQKSAMHRRSLSLCARRPQDGAPAAAELPQLRRASRQLTPTQAYYYNATVPADPRPTFLPPLCPPFHVEK